MRTRTVVTAPIAIIALLLSLPAFAQDYARTGFYGGFDLLGAHYTDEPGSFDIDTTFAFDVLAGFRVHPHFAIEGEFEYLTETDVDVSGVGEVLDLETWTLTANGKLFILTENVQPFVKFGMGVLGYELEDDVAFVSVSEDEAGFVARFGGGIDFYVTENVLITGGLDYLIPAGDVDDADYISFGVGAQYRF